MVTTGSAEQKMKRAFLSGLGKLYIFQENMNENVENSKYVNGTMQSGGTSMFSMLGKLYFGIEIS